MFTLPARRDGGFTLVELLLAIVIMGIAIAALVTAMSGLVIASENHRGHAVNETIAHSYYEQMNNKVNFSTTLAAGIDDSTTTICVTDSPLAFLSAGAIDLVIDMETFSTTIPATPTHCASPAGSWRLTVGRGAGSTQTAAHPTGSLVHQLFVCPGATADGPSGVGYVNPDGTPPFVSAPPAGVTASITGISYWDPATKAFDFSQTQCFSGFTTRCADADAPHSAPYDLLPECDNGAERVTLNITDQNHVDGATGTSCGTGWVCTTEQIIVRRGSG